MLLLSHLPPPLPTRGPGEALSALDGLKRDELQGKELVPSLKPLSSCYEPWPSSLLFRVSTSRS